jgi:4-amino-4-deoxy-L-arabinose transferase-like glycosyltransferase
MSVSEMEKTQRNGAIDVGEQVALFIISALFVLLGQSLVQVLEESDLWQAYAISIIGMILFLLTVRAFTHKQLPSWFYRPIKSASNWLGIRSFRFHFLWAAPIFAMGAWIAAGEQPLMRSFPVALLAWITAIAFLIVSYWDQLKGLRIEDWSKKDTWAIVILTVLSFLLRGILLDRIPWVLTGDEGSAGLSAVQFIDGTRNNIFTVGWFSFPAMFFGVQSISIRLLGQTVVGLRLPSMIAGALSIPAMYFFSRLAFGKITAIMASAFIMTFHFHIHFSRIALNNIWDGLFIILFSALLWWAWKGEETAQHNTSGLFLLAGLVLGLGQYFYSSVRILFAMLALWLFILAIQNWSNFKKRLPGLFALAIGAVTIVLPLAMFYIKYPDQFTAPFQRVSILGSWLENEVAQTGESALLILANQFKLAALAFTHINLRHWYMPNHPMLLIIPSALFLLGVVILFVRIKEPRYNWLILWIFSAIVISALSESTPASQRLTFVAPAVSIAIVLPLKSIIDWFDDSSTKRRHLTYFLAGAILLTTMGADLYFYFKEYTGEQKFSDLNTEVANETAKYLLSLDQELDVYFFGLPRMGYYSHSTIPFLVPEANGMDVIEEIKDYQSPSVERPTVYIFLPERLDELKFIRDVIPDPKLVVKKGRDSTHLFTALEIYPDESK